jgi:hypothetical protein
MVLEFYPGSAEPGCDRVQPVPATAGQDWAGSAGNHRMRDKPSHVARRAVQDDPPRHVSSSSGLPGPARYAAAACSMRFAVASGFDT